MTDILWKIEMKEDFSAEDYARPWGGAIAKLCRSPDNAA